MSSHSNITNLVQDPNNPGIWFHSIITYNENQQTKVIENQQTKVIENQQTKELSTNGLKKVNRCALCTKPCNSGNICDKCK